MNDADFAPIAEAVRSALYAQGFMGLVGAAVDHVAPGRIVMSVARRQELLQQNGLFHGGVIGFLVDNCTAAAAGTIIGPGTQGVVTAEYKVNILAPARGERLICEANVIKAGRMLTVVEAKVYSEAGGERNLIAVGLASIANLDRPASDTKPSP